MNDGKHTEGDTYRIGQRLQKIARTVTKELSRAAGGKWVGFSLIVWGDTGGHVGRMQYVSNTDRESVKEAMREMLAKWDRDGEELGVPKKPLSGDSDG